LLGDSIIIVDFFATWCGPCKILGPVLGDIANEVEDVTVVKINIEEGDNSVLAAQYGIKNIPTVVIFKDGQQVDKFVGAQSKDSVLAIVNRHTEKTDNE